MLLPQTAQTVLKLRDWAARNTPAVSLAAAEFRAGEQRFIVTGYRDRLWPGTGSLTPSSAAPDRTECAESVRPEREERARPGQAEPGTGAAGSSQRPGLIAVSRQLHPDLSCPRTAKLR